jgi:hypothetical protein
VNANFKRNHFWIQSFSYVWTSKAVKLIGLANDIALTITTHNMYLLKNIGNPAIKVGN